MKCVCTSLLRTQVTCVSPQYILNLRIYTLNCGLPLYQVWSKWRAATQHYVLAKI